MYFNIDHLINQERIFRYIYNIMQNKYNFQKIYLEISSDLQFCNTQVNIIRLSQIILKSLIRRAYLIHLWIFKIRLHRTQVS